MVNVVKNKNLNFDVSKEFWNSSLLDTVGNANIRLRHVSKKVTKLHQHIDSSEAFYLLEGKLKITISDIEHSMEPGDFITVEPGELHFISVEDNAVMLVIDNILT